MELASGLGDLNQNGTQLNSESGGGGPSTQLTSRFLQGTFTVASSGYLVARTR